MALPSRCPICGADLDATLPECPMCHGHVPAEEDTVPDAELPRKFPVPWGLLIVLAVYFASVAVYAELEKRRSPEYQAALHVEAAMKVLGRDGGESAATPKLLEALDHFIGALSLLPDDLWCHERVEQIARRLSERNVALPRETQRIVDALALKYRRIQDGRKSEFLPIGARDIWDLDTILDRPKRIMRYSLFGAGVIVAAWLYMVVGQRRRTNARDAERLDDRRRELAELGQHRRKL